MSRTWLTFLRALELVRKSPRGFVRTGRTPDREAVVDGLRENVFGARELESALGTDPLTVDEAFATVEDLVPRWERAKDPEWRETWRSRVEHLLEWLVLAGLANRVEGGYVRA